MRHNQGGYVLDKLLDFGDATDILEATKLLRKTPYSFMQFKHSSHRIIKIVDKLVRPCFYVMALLVSQLIELQPDQS